MFNEECQVEAAPEAVIVQPDMTYFMRGWWPRSDSNAHNCKSIIKARVSYKKKGNSSNKRKAMIKEIHIIYLYLNFNLS